MTTTALTRTHTCEHIKYWTSTPQPERVTAVTQNTAERRARYNTRKNEAPPFPFPGRHCGCRVWVAGRGGGGAVYSGVGVGYFTSWRLSWRL